MTIALPMLSIGFCTDIAGEEKLHAAGVERIWRRGNGNESLDDAVFEFRGRPGAIVLVDDLRVFGTTQRDILAKASEITRKTPDKAPIEIIDLTHPDEDVHMLVARALRALHAAAPIRNRRTARRRGRQGGLAKAQAAEAARATRIAPDIARRLCASRLTWKEIAEILGMPISTVQRHYGPASVSA